MLDGGNGWLEHLGSARVDRAQVPWLAFWACVCPVRRCPCPWGFPPQGWGTPSLLAPVVRSDVAAHVLGGEEGGREVGGFVVPRPKCRSVSAIAEAGTEAVTSVGPVLRTSTLDACIRPDLDVSEAVRRIEAVVCRTDFKLCVYFPSCPHFFVFDSFGHVTLIQHGLPWLCSPCCVANVIGRESRGTGVLALGFLIVQQQKGAEMS